MPSDRSRGDAGLAMSQLVPASWRLAEFCTHGMLLRMTPNARVQVQSGFATYVNQPAYPDGYLPTPAYPGVSVECSGYCA